MNYEQDEVFRAITEPLNDIYSQARAAERAKRLAFVQRCREDLLRLLGYPHGLPEMKNLKINRAYHLEGDDSELFVRVWTPISYEPKLLHAATAEVEFDFDSINVTKQSLAVQALTGSNYDFIQEYDFIPSTQNGPRSSATRTAADLPLREGLMPADSSEAITPDPLRHFPDSPIIRMNSFTDVTLENEVFARSRAEATFLPLLERLSYYDMRKVN